MPHPVKDWRMWAKGLVAAFVGGAVNSLTMGALDKFFQLQMTPRQFGFSILGAGITAVIFYYKKSPIPWQEYVDDSTEE